MFPPFILDCGIQQVQCTQNPEEIVFRDALLGGYAERLRYNHLVDTRTFPIYVCHVDSLNSLFFCLDCHCSFVFLISIT